MACPGAAAPDNVNMDSKDMVLFFVVLNFFNVPLLSKEKKKKKEQQQIKHL